MGGRVAGAGRKCTVCHHPERNSIDRLLVAPGKNLPEIGRLFKITARTLGRHRTLHLSKLLKNASAVAFENSEIERGGSLLQQAEDMQQSAYAILADAESSKNHAMALKAIKEARGCLEMRAKLTGQVHAGTVINNVAIFHNPMWVTVQSNILAALAPFPDAYVAVLEALEPISNG